MESAITAYLIDVVKLYFFTMVGMFLLARFVRTATDAILGGALSLLANLVWFWYFGMLHINDRWLYDVSRAAPEWLFTVFIFLLFGTLMRAATSANLDGDSGVSTDPIDITDSGNMVNTMNPGSPLNRRNR